MLSCVGHQVSTFAFKDIFNLRMNSMFPDADRRDPVEVKSPTMNDTTWLSNDEEAFALEPVAITRRHKHIPCLWSFNVYVYYVKS